ncbi:MAG: MFS transporter [Patescibacteria group bacterium]
MRRSPVYLIAVLSLLNLANYADRYLIAPLGPEIQRSLGLNDAQLGLLGSAFLWGFLAASLVAGFVARKLSRKTLLAVSAALWMLATCVTGWAAGLLILLAFRVAVGLGQALFTTLAPTAINDSLPQEKLGRALSVFYAAVPIGTALGFILGGLLGRAFGWQNAFLVSGLIGLPLILLLIPLKDRQQETKLGSYFRDLAKFKKAKRYWLTVAGYAAQTFALGGFAFWSPTYVERRFAMPATQSGIYMGILLVAAGFGGAILGGWMLDKFHDKDRVRAALKVSTLATLACIPFAFLTLATTSIPAFFFALGIVELAVFATFSPINAAFLNCMAPALRTTAMGLATFFGRLLGDLVSLWLVGLLSDSFQDLNKAMYVLPAALVLNLGIWWVASKEK